MLFFYCFVLRSLSPSARIVVIEIHALSGIGQRYNCTVVCAMKSDFRKTPPKNLYGVSKTKANAISPPVRKKEDTDSRKRDILQLSGR